MAAKCVSKLSFTSEDTADSEQLEPASESLLRSLKVHDSVIVAMRVNEVTDRTLFTDLAQDEQQLKKRGNSFGIDTSEEAEFSHQHEMAKLVGAWRQAKMKTTADAAAKAHGEPVRMLAMDWNSLMEKFKKTYGSDLCENELPAQSCYEEFEESSLEAERLRDVVSEEEAQGQRNLKADTARQYGMRLDGKRTLQTWRKFTSESRGAWG